MNIDAGSAILLVLGCAVLCVVGFVLMSALQFIGGILEFFGSFLGMFFEILSGGPVSWCGCLLALVGLAGCCIVALLIAQSLATCGTPQATNFCSLFGQ
jgi:hypothetical protein